MAKTQPDLGREAKHPGATAPGLASLPRPAVARRRRWVSPVTGWQIYLFLLPSVLLICGIILYPVVNTIYLSFRTRVTVRGSQPAGLSNFEFLTKAGDFWQVLLQTIIWTVAIVGGTMFIALIIALVINERFPGRKLVRSLLLLPWATSLAFSAVMWRFLLDPFTGLVNPTLKALGIIDRDVGWLARQIPAFPVLILIGIWASVPFAAIMILSSLQSIPRELYEPATLEGANYIQKTLIITLPSIRPVLGVVTLGNFIVVFNSFPTIWILTEGGPLNSTHILATFLYEEAFKFLDFGRASALAVVVFVILLVFSLIYLRSMREALEDR